jgi:hypothetical protein
MASPAGTRDSGSPGAGRGIRMMETLCVFNRTRESFLCLRAVEALRMPSASSSWVEGMWAEPAREDGILLMRSPGIYTVGGPFPVDRIYLDRGNRVLQLIEHLDPLQLVPVRCQYWSVLNVRIRTIYSSCTRVGDELLICFPEQVRMQWGDLQDQGSWTRKEEVPCSKACSKARSKE